MIAIAVLLVLAISDGFTVFRMIRNPAKINRWTNLIGRVVSALALLALRGLATTLLTQILWLVLLCVLAVSVAVLVLRWGSFGRAVPEQDPVPA